MTTNVAARSAPILPVVGVIGAVAALIAVVRIALQSRTGQSWDHEAMSTVYAGREARLAVLSVLGRVSIGLVAGVLVVCVGAAILRGRRDLAAGALVIVVGSNVTTQLLKNNFLDRPDLGFGTSNSLPSGHTTVVASAVAAVILVAPAAVRGLLALGGGAAATMTGASTIVAAWHRPADVFAALIVCTAWTALVSIVVQGVSTVSFVDGMFSLVGAGAALIALVAVGVRPIMGWDGFTEASLVLGAVAAATAAYVWIVCAVVPRVTSETFHVEHQR